MLANTPPEETFEASLLREAIGARVWPLLSPSRARAPGCRALTLRRAAARASGLGERVVVPVERMRWSKVRDALRPTQAALGFDWVFYKLKNFTSADAAQKYMDTKPVPYVLRNGKLYIVDHHHTLVALDLFARNTGADPFVTMEQIRSFDSAGDGASLSTAAFWGFMEGKGWAFLRDASYNRTPVEALPQDLQLASFRNDVFRSAGGFARVFGALKRGKELSDMLFFEFRWGYLFWLHRNDGFGLWPDKRLLRAFQRHVALIGEIDAEEYAEEVAVGSLAVKDAIFLSTHIIEPAYQNLTLYLRALCIAYDDQKGPAKEVLGLRAIFGSDELPGKVIRP